MCQDVENEICQQEKNNINFSKAAVQSAVHWHESIPSALAATDQ